MKNLKLVVLFLCFDIALCSINYCKICPNHTLCNYTMPGPSSSCKEYDEENLLTEDDIVNIVNRINERRNFIAIGLARLLPQAANMNKMRWSQELAVFAQRWVDQCSPATRPDKEDECRDLEGTEVGQNIASVTGPAPGMHVRSLIDVWFTESLDYKGAVPYYNHSRDWKTNYFTQLIWGDTDRVGCGKARFYVEEKNTMIERLVCNFAPKGNIHGKPVYAVGYPATQCLKNRAGDKEFKGLCSYRIKNDEGKFTHRNPSVSSLLRILNLSNNSVKQEIDPVRNNLKQQKFNYNETNEQRNQKIRHVFLNNSYVPMKNLPPMSMYNKRNYHENISRNQRIQQYQQERGHSRVYHGHDLHDSNFRTVMKQQATSENLRKFYFTSESPTSIENDDDYRKYYKNDDCTRSNIMPLPVPVKSDCTTCESLANQCTRGKVTENCPQPVKQCPHSANMAKIQHAVPHNLCPCNIPTTTCAPTPTKCQCNINCQCLKVDCTPTQCPTHCPPLLRRNNGAKDDTSKPSEFHYYDLLPNMAVRSGETDNRRSKSRVNLESASSNSWLHQDSTIGNMFKHFPHSVQDHNQGHHKKLIAYDNLNIQEPDYIYDSSDSRERERRTTADEMTFKPFWQIDEFQRPSQLKSMKYTTLHKKQMKTKRTTAIIRLPQTTETITVNLKDGSNTMLLQKNVITEKYLSFDELMHLRKFGSTESSTIVDARRTDSSSATAPSGYTVNTPFARKKHCTRKLTCTWTAVTITDANGSVIGGPGMDDDRGSRTPPGYVDGCTRTSTCTRDYLDRNKFSTIGVIGGDSSDDNAATTLEDEDYCERKALNVRRRDSSSASKGDPKGPLPPSTDLFTEPSYYISKVLKVTYFSEDGFTTPTPMASCICPKDNRRVKRNKYDEVVIRDIYNKKEKRSFGDLYYLILQKIINKWKQSHSPYDDNSCLCNASTLVTGSILFIIFMLLNVVTINLFF